MSAAGAVSGNGIYSTLEHKGAKFNVGQWTMDALDAVSTAAFRKAKRMADDAEERAILNRMWSMGGFSFDVIAVEGGLDRDKELLSTFLYHLMEPHNESITLAVVEEIVAADFKKAWQAAYDANPQNARKTAPKKPGKGKDRGGEGEGKGKDDADDGE
jgi:hypothetical protein